jgi:hypothetical protein
MIRNLLLGAVALASATSASAVTNLVTNGSFEVTTNGIGQPDFNTTLVGWNNYDGYNFVVDSNIDSTGVQGVYGSLSLHGPNNGTANSLGVSPDGGLFFAAGGAFGVAPLQQTLTGLTTGQTYVVSFYWAAAQHFRFDGATTEKWDVSFGGVTQSTAVYNNVDHGFGGWFSEKFRFTANDSTQVLSFLAVGTPDGLPPFSLLDGVSVAAVPEASTWAMLIAGFGLVGAAARRRRMSTAAA